MKDNNYVALAFLLLILLFAFPLTAGASGDTVEGGVDTENVEEPVELLVNLDDLEVTKYSQMESQADLSQQSLIDYVESTDRIQLVNRFWITNTVLVEVEPKYDLEKLTRIEGVSSLHPNTQMEALDSVPSNSYDSLGAVSRNASTDTTESVSTTSTALRME